MTESFQADVKQIKISEIVVGERRRQKLGDLRGLIRSIRAHGLLHPIIVRNGNELVAGQRRLEACKRLGWNSITARHVETMNDEELRAIEFEENAERLALTNFEGSKQRLAQIRQAEADAKAEEFRSKLERNSKRGRKGEGRPKGPGSKRDIAERTGIPPAAQVRIEQHVALAEQYPFFQKNDWVQHQVLEAGIELDKLPEQERGSIAALLDQDAIPPKKAIAIIRNIGEIPTSERKMIWRLAASDDEHERRTALTKAACLPPPLDPALNRLHDARSALIQAVKVCRTKPFIEPLSSVRDTVNELAKRFSEYSKENHDG